MLHLSNNPRHFCLADRHGGVFNSSYKNKSFYTLFLEVTLTMDRMEKKVILVVFLLLSASIAAYGLSIPDYNELGGVLDDMPPPPPPAPGASLAAPDDSASEISDNSSLSANGDAEFDQYTSDDGSDDGWYDEEGGDGVGEGYPEDEPLYPESDALAATPVVQQPTAVQRPVAIVSGQQTSTNRPVAAQPARVSVGNAPRTFSGMPPAPPPAPSASAGSALSAPAASSPVQPAPVRNSRPAGTAASPISSSSEPLSLAEDFLPLDGSPAEDQEARLPQTQQPQARRTLGFDPEFDEEFEKEAGLPAKVGQQQKKEILSGSKKQKNAAVAEDEGMGLIGKLAVIFFIALVSSVPTYLFIVHKRTVYHAQEQHAQQQHQNQLHQQAMLSYGQMLSSLGFYIKTNMQRGYQFQQLYPLLKQQGYTDQQITQAYQMAMRQWY